eukprot:2514642-Rhodomonas_salina.2
MEVDVAHARCFPVFGLVSGPFDHHAPCSLAAHIVVSAGSNLGPAMRPSTSRFRVLGFGLRV